MVLKSWLSSGREADTINSINVDKLIQVKATNKNLKIVDVRKRSEYAAEHVADVLNSPLDYINDDAMESLSKDSSYYVHCKSGYRSVVFTSILQARGYDKLINIEGGFEAIADSKAFDLTDYVCPSTL